MTSSRWHRRMMRLERLLPMPVQACIGCNFPEVILRGVVMTTGDELVPECHECNRHIAHDGTPLCDTFKHIILPEEGFESRFVHLT
ncbi:MAG: hypothetical protein O7G85_08440 [Planctomycetota bacterium]|nr:hypothetical protein [Planctomycetota bacterium]